MASSVKLDVDFNHVPSLYKKRKSPNFKDVLRERCYTRIKAKRQALMDKFRYGSDRFEVKDVLCDIIHEEAQVLKNGPSVPMDFIDSNSKESIAVPLDDIEGWLFDEYEKVLAEAEARFQDEWQNQVICPICEKCALNAQSSATASPPSFPVITCSYCRTVFPPVDSLRSLSEIIDTTLDDHSSRCDESLFFLVLPSPEPCLYTICSYCGQYSRAL